MTGACEHVDDGAVELFFYDELTSAERDAMAAHIRACRHCAAAVEDLKTIRAALAARPDIAAPESGNWSRFMQRLDAAVLAPAVVAFEPRRRPRTSRLRSYAGLLATAALLAIVTGSVWYAANSRAGLRREAQQVQTAPPETGSLGDATPVATAGMRSLGEQHFERSKLVVLGLAAKEPGGAGVSDWAYERELASSLLSDTRLYRLAAEERGLTSLAGVMRDLELVLLETSMSQGADPGELPQIQRLIRKRQLIQKMDVVNTVGLVP
jgi:hypothetical protein